jgi:hypothetical protein
MAFVSDLIHATYIKKGYVLTIFDDFVTKKCTLCPPKFVTEQVKVASRPTATVTFSNCPRNLGIRANTSAVILSIILNR